MRTLTPALKVSLAFLGVGVASYWAFMMLAKGKCAGEGEPMLLRSYFSDATLLVQKSRVQIAGLTVGYIASRDLDVRPPRAELVTEKRFARVTVALKPDVTVYSNAVIFKRTASLLGEFYLEIDPGTYEWTDETGKRHVGERLKSGDEIRNVVEAATAGRVMTQISELLPQIQGILKDIGAFTRGPLMDVGNGLNEAIQENRENFKTISENIAAVTQEASRLTHGSGEDIRTIIENVKAISSSLKDLVASTRPDKSDVRYTVSKLNTAVDRLDNALRSAEKVGEAAEQVAEDLKQGKGSVGRLLRDDTLVTEAEDVVHSAGSIVRSIAGLQTVVGLRSEYNFSANTIKTYVSIELWPRLDKYYLIELVDDPRGHRSLTTTITRTDDPSRPALVREDKIQVSNSFRFSFQFAKRISFATFRFGIKESTGGAGVDFRFLRDQLQVWTDLFDFQTNVWPRFKAAVAWEFFRHLYVVGGIDDAINARSRDGVGGGRDFYVGAQLRFNDQDLRQLLLFGGGAAAGAAAK